MAATTTLHSVVPTHFVLVQHGSHGREEHLRYITEHLICVGEGRIQPWSSDCNERGGTDKGTMECCNLLWGILRPVLEDFIPKAEAEIHKTALPPPTDDRHSSVQKPCFSAIAHSWGGIVIREIAFRVHLTFGDRLMFHTFATLATPHLGVTEMCSILQKGASLVGTMRSKTYSELVLDLPFIVDDLVDDAHLAALRSFAARLLYCNLQDHLVSFNTSSLTTNPQLAARCLAECEAHPTSDDPLHPHVFPALPSRIVFPPDTVSAVMTVAWPEATVQERVARARQRLLRLGGFFTVYPCYFPERFVIAHAAIIGRMPLRGKYFQDVSHHAAAACAQRYTQHQLPTDAAVTTPAAFVLPDTLEFEKDLSAPPPPASPALAAAMSERASFVSGPDGEAALESDSRALAEEEEVAGMMA